MCSIVAYVYACLCMCMFECPDGDFSDGSMCMCVCVCVGGCVSCNSRGWMEDRLSGSRGRVDQL